MPEILFLLLVVLCMGLVIRGLQDTSRVMEFPFFTAVTVLGFMGPQMLSLLVHSTIMPREVLARGIFMTILCVGMGWLGYRRGVHPTTLSHWVFPSRPNKLVIWAVIYGVFSVVLYWQVRQAAKDMESSTQWSGTITKLVFFSQSNLVALTIALLAYFRKPSIPLLVLVLFCSIPLLHRIYVGRRSSFFLLFAISGCCLFFVRGFKPPRWAVIWLGIIGFVVVFSIAEYRRMVHTGDLSLGGPSGRALREELERSLALDEYYLISETGAAFYTIEACRQSDFYEHGSIFWNRLVHGLVPAQYVGREFKEALKMSDENYLERYMYVNMGITIPIGQTRTGIGTAYAQFGYLGCLIFFVLGRFYRYMWEAIKVPSNEIMRVIYPGMVVFGMHVITHNVAWYSDKMVYYAIFLLVPYLHSRIPSSQWGKLRVMPAPVGVPAHATS